MCGVVVRAVAELVGFLAPGLAVAHLRREGLSGRGGSRGGRRPRLEGAGGRAGCEGRGGGGGVMGRHACFSLCVCLTSVECERANAWLRSRSGFDGLSLRLAVSVGKDNSNLEGVRSQLTVA